MRTIYLLSLMILTGLFSCNSSSTQSTNTDTAASAMATDTGMHMMADSAKMIAPLPAIPAGAAVYFKNLKNGETVKSPFKVEMGVKNMKVDTAGLVLPDEGHHHLLIDAGDSVAAGTVVPKDAQHIHFGKGQTETTVTLPPGKHRLTLQYADGIHRSYGAALSATIEVNVK
ncbi:MAG TPA: rod shape-determining protein RodA [Chitinophagaceae bacterium]|nr:rod shape-determining protein RodA [Chitinophagaceae bacterium]